MHSQDKRFEPGEQVLILHPDSTASNVFSSWKGSATVVEVKSPYSYIVEYIGGRQHVHANKLRKYNVRVDEVLCKSLLLSDDLMQPEVSTWTLVPLYMIKTLISVRWKLLNNQVSCQATKQNCFQLSPR